MFYAAEVFSATRTNATDVPYFYIAWLGTYIAWFGTYVPWLGMYVPSHAI